MDCRGADTHQGLQSEEKKKEAEANWLHLSWSGDQSVRCFGIFKWVLVRKEKNIPVEY